MMLRVPLAATIVVVAVVLLYALTGSVAANHKLAALEPLPPRGNYRITLAFEPERFHQVRLQSEGRLVGVQGRTVLMMDVTPAGLRDIAREYWVDAVARWSGS
jgi:hypothetical protein